MKLRNALPWVLVLALLSVAGLGHGRSKEVERAIDEGRHAFDAGGTLAALRLYLTNDGDQRRYYSYTNAALGRPYQAHFVRSIEAWRGDFATGQFSDPDSRPWVTPPAPLLPYRDFLVEYPPGFFVWALPIALVPVSADTWGRLFALLMALLLTLALPVGLSLAPALGLPANREQLWRWAAGGALALGVVCTHRYDAVVALLLCVMCWGVLTARPGLGGLAAGLAFATKLTPLLPAGILGLFLLRQRRLRELGWFTGSALASSAAILLPALWLAGPHLGDLLAYHADRPAQIESTGGALLIAARLLPQLRFEEGLRMVQTFGSFNLQGPGVGALSGASSLATVLGLLYVCVRLLRGLAGAGEQESRRLAAVAVLQSLVAFMVLGKVFSPQYLVWILPLGLVVSGASLRARGLLLSALLLTQVIYPICYGPLSELQPWAGLNARP